MPSSSMCKHNHLLDSNEMLFCKLDRQLFYLKYKLAEKPNFRLCISWAPSDPLFSYPPPFKRTKKRPVWVASLCEYLSYELFIQNKSAKRKPVQFCGRSLFYKFLFHIFIYYNIQKISQEKNEDIKMMTKLKGRAIARPYYFTRN